MSSKKNETVVFKPWFISPLIDCRVWGRVTAYYRKKCLNLEEAEVYFKLSLSDSLADMSIGIEQANPINLLCPLIQWFCFKKITSLISFTNLLLLYAIKILLLTIQFFWWTTCHLGWNTKLNSLAAPTLIKYVHMGKKYWKSVSSHIQTPRSVLKKRGTAEYF